MTLNGFPKETLPGKLSILSHTKARARSNVKNYQIPRKLPESCWLMMSNLDKRSCDIPMVIFSNVTRERWVLINREWTTKMANPWNETKSQIAINERWQRSGLPNAPAIESVYKGLLFSRFFLCVCVCFSLSFSWLIHRILCVCVYTITKPYHTKFIHRRFISCAGICLHALYCKFSAYTLL